MPLSYTFLPLPAVWGQYAVMMHLLSCLKVAESGAFQLWIVTN